MSYGTYDADMDLNSGPVRPDELFSSMADAMLHITNYARPPPAEVRIVVLLTRTMLNSVLFYVIHVFVGVEVCL